MKNFTEFIAWEKTSLDTIDFKRIYADMAGDTLAGLVLSQIVYWHIPNKQGQSKLRIEKEGKKWMACNRAEWWDSTRLTPRQIDRVLQILEDKKLIEKKIFKFYGSPTVHVRINEDVFVMAHNSYIANPLPNPYATEKKDIAAIGSEIFSDITDSLNGNYANGEMEINESVKSLTKTTTETTTEKKDIAAKSPRKKTDADLLATSFGVEAKSTKDFKLWGSIARDLKEAGIDAPQYPSFIEWIRNLAKSQGNWDVTPHSLTSNARPATYLAELNKPKAQSPQLPRKAPVNLDFLEGK